MAGNAKIGVALAGGYLLGRTKKAKMAIGLGMFLAGKKLSLDPSQLGKMVAGSPVLGSLNSRVRKELVEATKSAATSALTQRATGLAESLHERTRALDEPGGRDEPDETDDPDETDEPAEDKTTSGARRPRTPSARTRKTAPAAAKKASGTRKTASRTRTTKARGGRDE